MLLDNKIVNLIRAIQGYTSDQEQLRTFFIKNKITSLANQILKIDHSVLLLADAEKAQLLNELLLSKFNSVASLLREQKLNFIPLKGLHLIYQLPEYGKIRDIKDIDLLIEGQDLAKAIQILTTNGWSAKFPSTQQKQKLELFVNHSVTLMETVSGIELDLHWKLAEGFVCDYVLSKEYLAASKYDNQDRYSFPCWEYQILFIIVHSYKNRWQQLQAFIDLYLIMSNHQIDFDKLASLVNKYNISLIYQETMQIMDLLFGLNLSSQQLALDIPKALEKINKLKNISDVKMITTYIFGFNKIKFMALRYLLPFGPDLQSKQNLIFIFLRKYHRLFIKLSKLNF